MLPADPITSAITVSLEVSVISTLLAAIPGIGIGLAIGIERFRGRSMLIALLYTALAFPTVVIGLFVYFLLSRSGPLGDLGLLYSKTAIVLGQTIMIVPILMTFTLSAVKRLDPALTLTARSLGASRGRLYATLAREARFGILAAVIASFGRAISEVGVSMILGGNIAGHTRTMTTVIALEHDKGQFHDAMILGVLLLTLSLCINIGFHALQRRSESRDD